MTSANIDDFYHAMSEILMTLYAAFPVPHLLLIEDIVGPIQWDLTGLPDRRSRACFETLMWLNQAQILDYRSVEPRDLGVEGAVLTQQGFVLLTQRITWSDGVSQSRIDALKEARAHLAYDNLATVAQDLIQTNCQWQARLPEHTLERSAQLDVAILDDEEAS